MGTDVGPDDRRVLDDHAAVLQAEGFVALQLGDRLDVAADVLARYAAALRQELPEVARAVLDGRLSFGVGGR